MTSFHLQLSEMNLLNRCGRKIPRDFFREEGEEKAWDISCYGATRRKIFRNDKREKAGKDGRKRENESDQNFRIRALPVKCKMKQSDRRPLPELGKVDCYGNNLLHQAFLHGDTTLSHVKLLLRRKKVLAITRNKRGRLPLHSAIETLYRNKDAFGSHAYDMIDTLCKVEPRMVSFKDGKRKDALDLAHNARSHRSHLGWLYDYLLATKVAIYRKQKRFWEEHGFAKVLPPEESYDITSVSSPSSLSCCPSYTLTEKGGWAIDTRGVYV